MNPSALPQNYWINTGNNDIIRRFIQKAGFITKREIEELIAGGIVRKAIKQDLTYGNLDSSIDNLWSLLFTTGYLTQRGEQDGDMLSLAIPNREIRQIFVRQVLEWFDEEASKDIGKLDILFQSMQEGDASAVEKILNEYLRRTISIRDYGVQKERKESFYHGILLGLLGHMEGWDVSSNAETGEGYSDILVITDNAEGMGIIIEIKYAEDGNLEASCRKALEQIETRRYAETFEGNGIQSILKYGIACYKKSCMVMAGRPGFVKPNM